MDKDTKDKEAERLKEELAFFEDNPASKAEDKPVKPRKRDRDWTTMQAGSITDLYADTEKPRMELVSWPYWDEKTQTMVDRKYEIGIVDISWEKLNQIIDEAYNTTQSVQGRKRKVQIERMKIQIKTIAGSVPVWAKLDPAFCEQLRMTVFGELEDDRTSLMEGEFLKNLLQTLMKDETFINSLKSGTTDGTGQERAVRSPSSSGSRRRKRLSTS